MADKTTTNDTILKNLVSWIEKAGGSVHASLVLKETSGSDRGIFASKPIAKGDLLVRLPAARVVSGEKLPSKFGSKEARRNASPWLRCLAGLYLAQDDPEWKNYTGSLPAQYETLMQWDDNDAKSLAGTTLGASLQSDRTEKATQNRFKDYVQPYLKFLKIKRGDVELFEKISMGLSTRGFHMQPSDEDIKEDAKNPYLGPFLLPVVDLLNHTDDPKIKATTLQRDTASKDFVMIAERDIEAGEEVLHSYGDKLTSAQLLQTFGFVPKERMAMDNTSPMHKTPAMLSQQVLMDACTSVKQSTYPTELRKSMQESEREEVEVFDLPHSTKKRDTSFLPDSMVVEGLTDEIVTFCAIQMLPDEVYEEVGQDLLQPEILEDYYLGKLVGMALLQALKTKVASYTAMSGGDDRTVLAKLMASNKSHTPSTLRTLSGLTIRMEEKASLEALQKQVLDLLAALDDGDGGDDDEEEDELEALLQQRLEEQKPSKKAKTSE